MNNVIEATFTSGTSSGRGAPRDSQVVIQRNPYGVRVLGREARSKISDNLHQPALVAARGGVEDTRLEAKDTKKIRGQGQGQPFRGQTLSRPRTEMLKDQGHKRKCSPKKKKVFTKIF